MAHGSSNLWLSLFSNTASLTCLAPVFNHVSNTWPVAPRPNQLCSGLDTLVAVMGVQLLEHFLPQALWKHKLVDTLSAIGPLVHSVQKPFTYGEPVPLV